jgi:septal ring factor EnvC (AmiA/AmiB activator)
LQPSARAGFPSEGQNYRELYTPATEPNKENIGETFERIRSSEVDKHARLQDEIQALKHQQSAITDRIARLEEQAAKARRNSGRARRFLERPEKLLRLDRSSLYKWIRAMDTPEPRNSSLRQSNGGNECADENPVIVLSD